MLKMEINKGVVTLELNGKGSDLMAELLVGLDAFYREIAKDAMTRERFAGVISESFKIAGACQFETTDSPADIARKIREMTRTGGKRYDA